MSDTVVSFSSSGLSCDKLRRILAEHAVYDQARVTRGAVLQGVLLLGAIDLTIRSVGFLPEAAFWTVLGLAAIVMAGALVRELRARGRFDRELTEVNVLIEDLQQGY